MPKKAVITPVSTRRTTRETGRFTRATPGSQSLERGLQLLRVFRPGVAVLSNAQLAYRTGLPRPTVSRLARSLVDAGFLAYDVEQAGYRLTAVCLSLALSFRSEQRALDLALPLMRSVAEGQRINVGLALADQGEMVYLDSVRQSRLGVFRRIVPGSRIPMELTSLGYAYLAAMDDTERRVLLEHLAAKHGRAWPALMLQIQRAITDVNKLGYCHATWQVGMVAIAAPVTTPDGKVHAVNISFPFDEGDHTAQVKTYSALLLQLVDNIHSSWHQELVTAAE